MSSIPPSRSNKAGWRGRHRHRGSPETRRWEEISGTAWITDNGHADGRVDPPQAVSEAPVASIPPAPPLPRPSWMTEADYQALIALRRALQA